MNAYIGECLAIKKNSIILLVIIAITVAYSQYAEAAEPTVVQRIIDEFTIRSQAWASKLENAVRDLFIICFTLELVMLGITALIKRESLEDIFGSLIMAALFGAFILACIMNYKEWSQAIMGGLANYTGLLGYDSSSEIITDPLKKGFDLFKKIISSLSWWRPGDSLAYILAGFAILISFALITIQIIYIKCEAFVAVGAGFILLGFGGCKFFKDYALNLMRYILSVGFKLYVLYVVLGLGISFINDLVLQWDFTLQDVAVILVTSLIILALTKSLPDVAAGLIQGSHVNTGGNMTSTIRTVANLTAAGAVAYGATGGKIVGGLGNLKDATQVARAGGATGIGVATGAIKALREAHSQAKLESPGASMALRVGSKLEAMKEAQLMNKAAAPAQAAVSLPDVSASRAAKRQDQSANSSRSLVNYMQPRKGIGGALASLGAKNI